MSLLPLTPNLSMWTSVSVVKACTASYVYPPPKNSSIQLACSTVTFSAKNIFTEHNPGSFLQAIIDRNKLAVCNSRNFQETGLSTLCLKLHLVLAKIDVQHTLTCSSPGVIWISSDVQQLSDRNTSLTEVNHVCVTGDYLPVRHSHPHQTQLSHHPCCAETRRMEAKLM